MGETHNTSSKRDPSQNEPTQTPPPWFDSILNITESPASSTPKIHKVPPMLRETKDFEKYYVPRLVSIGPYHHGNPKLQLIQNLKLVTASKLLKAKSLSQASDNRLQSVYNALSGMTNNLRSYYEEKTTDGLSDDEFTKMLLLDGCFILYFIKFIFFDSDTDKARSSCLGLKSHQIVRIQQDLFLLENQIPYLVLQQIYKSLNDDTWESTIRDFIKCITMTAGKEKQPSPTVSGDDHLLRLLLKRLSSGGETATAAPTSSKQSCWQRVLNYVAPTSSKQSSKQRVLNYTFRNVHELRAVGISVKPSKTCSIASIDWHSHGFCANLVIPKITVDDSTKSMVLNLVTYEMCLDDPNESWFTSYICLLDSLIDHSDDVKELRKAEVIENCLGSDEEVAQLFNEIGTDLMPNPDAYSRVMKTIQRHYINKGNSWVNQLRQEYIKSPWAFIALLGGVLGLALSAIQAYTGIQPGGCDSLCKYIESHHAI